jgi:hypothetical protein
VVPGCLALCWWQVTRAVAGNELSWAYVFEWPFFAGYAVFMWWRLVHEPPEADLTSGPRPSSTLAGATPATPNPIAGAGLAPAAGAEPGASTLRLGDLPGDDRGLGNPDDPDQEDREAYNKYLAELHARGRRSRW